MRRGCPWSQNLIKFNPLPTRTHRHSRVTQEPDQRHAIRVCQLNRERGDRGDGADDGDAGHEGLLGDLEASPAADQQGERSVLRPGQPALLDPEADGFVGGIVTADVFKNAAAGAVRVEEANRMQAAGLLKECLVRSERVREEYNWEYKLVDLYDAKGFKSETLSHDEICIGGRDAYSKFTCTGPILNP